ncbi:HAD family hydrolase [Rappaport israeli]|uniref:hypothetical protein n=1 Tax=Rappaport israeli TaxID=1839807 RepID=UPI00098F30C0|nr:hypothetical protein [Rappaport israeli]
MTTPTYHFDGILFDCDSTLSSIEGIDELAALNNQKQTIAQLTNQAMNGDLPLQAIYEKRLQHIQPTQQQIQQIAQQYLKTITQGAETLIATLQRHNILVGIISGGLYDAILPLAQHLNIPTQHLHAVHLNYTPEDTTTASNPPPHHHQRQTHHRPTMETTKPP